MFESTTAELPQVIRMATTTPAERAGISDRTGSLASGLRADLLILDSNLEVDTVFARGQRFESGAD
jgi:N-acetylglucosamine-6-phosphate deacetylase